MLPALLLLAVPSMADAPLDKTAYAARFPLAGTASADYAKVAACLQSWTGQGLSAADADQYRLVDSSVRVMGFGSSEVTDDVSTSYPQVILVRPNVSVMTKTSWKLLNPNGWYCFDTSVAVMAKDEIELGCGAHLADGHSAVSVVGASDRSGGVTVLGEMKVMRDLCTKGP